MDRMKAWTKEQYPDRDRLKEVKLAEEERLKHHEEIAAQAMKKEHDEKTMSWEEKKRAEDIRDMSSFQYSEMGPPWITDLNNEQMGNITAWVRTLPATSRALGYALQDETIFNMKEMEHRRGGENGTAAVLRRADWWFPWKQGTEEDAGIQAELE
eukprot:14051673-Heterocapsa_arctica.AAC.1